MKTKNGIPSIKLCKVAVFLQLLAIPVVLPADEIIEGPYTEENPLSLTVSSGTTMLTGDKRIVLGDVLVTGSDSATYGTLRLENAKDVVFTNNTVDVGTLEKYNETRAQKTWPRMIVTNSFLGTTQLGSESYQGTLNVGKWMCGILIVESGGVVSNRLFVGGGSKAGGTSEGNAGQSVGAVYQRGGTVYALGKGGNDDIYRHSSLGLAGTLGSYSLENGEFRPLSAFGLGGAADGVLVQSGGLLHTTKHFYVGRRGASNGLYCQMGGTSYFGGYFWTIKNGSGSAIVSVVGPKTLFRSDYEDYGGVLLISSGDAAASTVINVNDGGTLECGGFAVMRDDYTSPFANVLNVNGGIICARARYSGSKFFGAAMSSSEIRKPIDRVAVYEKGMTFDTNSRSLQTFATIVGAEAGGFARICLSEPVTSVYAIPEVMISGDGYGATAVALLDTVNHCVTNILLTSRGWGYTKENTTITLRYNKYQVKKTLTEEEFDIGPMEAGGFTKTGTGTLTLTAGTTNTWKKWTRVYGGTLLVGGEGGLPTNTVLTLKNGATLDLNYTASSVTEVLHGIGGGTISNAENATVPGTIGYVIDLDEALAGKIVTLPTGTDLGTTKLVFRGDLGKLLTDGQRHPLFVTASGAFTGTPTVVTEPATTLPAGWKWYVHGGTVGVMPEKGLMIIFN